MRFVKCGSKLFRPDTVTAVDLEHRATVTSPAEVKVSVPGETLWFRGAEAKAVREFFSSIPATDLLRRDEPEAPEAVAANHSREEC
jgi:hypothetical protein